MGWLQVLGLVAMGWVVFDLVFLLIWCALASRRHRHDAQRCPPANVVRMTPKER